MAGISDKHKRRYAMFQKGTPIEEIARAEKVSEATVNDSIYKCEARIRVLTTQAAEQEMIETVLETAHKSRKALSHALEATEVVRDNDGDVIMDPETNGPMIRPDHKTRLAAVGEITKIVTAVQPKRGPMTSINVGVSTGAPAAPVITSGPGRAASSFEALLRNRRTQQVIEGNGQPALPASTSAPLEGEIVEADGDTVDVG